MGYLEIDQIPYTSSTTTTWPAVIVSDRELALVNAIVSKYPQQTMNSILC